jgi:hypothetical protein
MILMNTLHGTQRRMIQIHPCAFQSVDDGYMCAFRRDASGEVTHLFTNGTTAFEKISWYEATIFQRGLFGTCMLLFAVVSVVIPLTRKIRNSRGPVVPGVDAVRWFATTTASTFLLYVLGMGIVMGFVVPREELAVGFAHGIHWSLFIVQTIPLLGILLLAGLLGSLFWRAIGKKRVEPASRPRSGLSGPVTALAGMAFVWFLWYWNLVGYRF